MCTHIKCNRPSPTYRDVNGASTLYHFRLPTLGQIDSLKVCKVVIYVNLILDPNPFYSSCSIYSVKNKKTKKKKEKKEWVTSFLLGNAGTYACVSCTSVPICHSLSIVLNDI